MKIFSKNANCFTKKNVQFLNEKDLKIKKNRKLNSKLDKFVQKINRISKLRISSRDIWCFEKKNKKLEQKSNNLKIGIKCLNFSSW